MHSKPVIGSSVYEEGMDVARRGLYQVLVQKQLRLFVAVLRLISIPKGEVIDEQVQGTCSKTTSSFCGGFTPDFHSKGRSY